MVYKKLPTYWQPTTYDGSFFTSFFNSQLYADFFLRTNYSAKYNAIFPFWQINPLPPLLLITTAYVSLNNYEAFKRAIKKKLKERKKGKRCVETSCCSSSNVGYSMGGFYESLISKMCVNRESLWNMAALRGPSGLPGGLYVDCGGICHMCVTNVFFYEC